MNWQCRRRNSAWDTEHRGRDFCGTIVIVSTNLKIAVVAMQGDYAKHIEMLTGLGAEAYPARLPEEIAAADGVILPGGESTTIGKMLARYGVDAAIQQAAEAGKAVYGTCAGLILLARAIAAGTGEQGGQPTLGLLDAVVARNAFGRQVDSFEAALDVPALGAEPLRTVFIRAPYVVEAGPSVEVLARQGDKIVFVRQGRILGSAFHPELTADDRVHRYFLSLVMEGQLA
jgi:5'-phosphate synthase pdxT subunit